MKQSKVNARMTRLPIPSLRGNVHVAVTTEDSKNDEVLVMGDPEGLRSLAAVLNALADIDQQRLEDLLPEDAHEHLHLDPMRHLGQKSARLIVSRLDDKNGQLPFYYGKRLTRSRPIRETRLIKHV